MADNAATYSLGSKKCRNFVKRLFSNLLELAPKKEFLFSIINVLSVYVSQFTLKIKESGDQLHVLNQTKAQNSDIDLKWS